MPIPMTGSGVYSSRGFVIPAIGQRSDIPFLTPGSISERGNKYIVATDGQVKEYEGVFAAGDVVTGPSTVVEAIASGKATARNVMRYLEGSGE